MPVANAADESLPPTPPPWSGPAR